MTHIYDDWLDKPLPVIIEEEVEVEETDTEESEKVRGEREFAVVLDEKLSWIDLPGMKLIFQGSRYVDFVLAEADTPSIGGQPDAAGLQAPMTGMGAGAGGYGDPSTTNPVPQGNEPDLDGQDEEDDITGDPTAPDMPEQKDDDTDFETWRSEYFKLAVKGDSNAMIDSIHKVRDRELDSYQRKFVEDNLQVQFLRQDANIEKASKEVIKKVKEELDKNHPAVSLINHTHMVLQANPLLNNTFIKLNGLWGAKQDLHRKFVASLMNAVQVGGGGTENEDIVYNDSDFSVAISTRFNTRMGSVLLGSWSLKEDDAERYLQEAELKRLENGSPEEKDVLMRRLVMESIVNKYRTRAFIIHSVGKDGTLYSLGIDLSELLKSSYQDGKLVVRTHTAENSEAMINDDGAIIPYIDMDIKYVHHTGGQGEDGKPETKEVDFIEKKSGQLFLTASLDTIKDAGSALQGLTLKESPYNGNPNDLTLIQRCVPSVAEILTRRC